jgi:hypothetical protein
VIRTILLIPFGILVVLSVAAFTALVLHQEHDHSSGRRWFKPDDGEDEA